jgi:hypothetical protein
MNFFRTSCGYAYQHHLKMTKIVSLIAYLDCADVGVLADILVLVQGILGQFALLLYDRLFNQQEHHRLQRGDGDISGSLRNDMLVKKGEGSRGLPHAHKFVSALQHILGFLMWRRRHAGQAPLRVLFLTRFLLGIGNRSQSET